MHPSSAGTIRRRKMLKHRMNLHLFDVNPNVQTTLSADLSVEMKTFYSKYLIENAQAKLVHDQFGQKHPIPQHGGKIIEFRKYDPLAKALTKLTEGVTPNGNSLKVTEIHATIDQYGDYITLSDVLLLTAIDNNLVEANELLGQQAGLTLDTVTREVINGGSQVIYAGNRLSRAGLNGGDYISVDDFFNAQRILKRNNATDFGGTLVGIIHPDITYDVMRNPECTPGPLNYSTEKVARLPVPDSLKPPKLKSGLQA
jgi:N4-gp56 family major capsid protein